MVQRYYLAEAGETRETDGKVVFNTVWRWLSGARHVLIESGTGAGFVLCHRPMTGWAVRLER